VLEPARRQVKWVATIAAAAGLVVLGGCGGGGGGGDPKTGKQLFVQSCGSCHTLADANTKGAIGPDLDQAFAQSVRDGLGRDTIRGVVREQISLPLGAMPADLVKGKDADSVAAYVAEVAAKPGAGGGGGATGGGGSGGGGTAKASASNQLDIPTDPSGQLAYQFTKATAKAGQVTLLSKNDSPVPHDISIKGGGVAEQGDQVTDGGTSKLSVRLKPGKYTYYCSVPGHEQGGMKGTLTVK
jgi:mono/diheme cytochrome c family protein